MHKTFAAAICLILIFQSAAKADQLVVYHENGPGHLRGLFNFDTTTNTTTFRTAVQSPENFFSFTRRAADGAVFASAIDGNLFQINLNTGASTLIGNTGVQDLSSLAIDPVTNVLYALADSYVYKINAATASATLLGFPHGINGSSLPIQGLAFSPTDKLYTFQSGTLYNLNTTTLLATQDPVPSYETLFGDGECEGVCFSPDGHLYASDFNSNIFSVNLANGLGTQIGKTSDTYGQLALIVMPEPTSLTAIALILPLLRRRARN